MLGIGNQTHRLRSLLVTRCGSGKHTEPKLLALCRKTHIHLAFRLFADVQRQ
jgi:hypothetical protein